VWRQSHRGAFVGTPRHGWQVGHHRACRVEIRGRCGFSQPAPRSAEYAGAHQRSGHAPVAEGDKLAPGNRSADLQTLFGHVELDRAPDFDVLDALGAAHHVELEGLLGACVEAVGNIARGRLVRFELYVIHGSPYPSSRCTDPASPATRPCLRRMSPKRWRARQRTWLNCMSVNCNDSRITARGSSWR